MKLKLSAELSYVALDKETNTAVFHYFFVYMWQSAVRLEGVSKRWMIVFW